VTPGLSKIVGLDREKHEFLPDQLDVPQAPKHIDSGDQSRRQADNLFEVVSALQHREGVRLQLKSTSKTHDVSSKKSYLRRVADPDGRLESGFPNSAGLNSRSTHPQRNSVLGDRPWRGIGLGRANNSILLMYCMSIDSHD